MHALPAQCGFDNTTGARPSVGESRDSRADAETTQRMGRRQGGLRRRAIRVALLIDTFEGVTGGTERQFMGIAGRLDRRIFSVYVHCLQSSATFPEVGRYLSEKLPDSRVRVWNYEGICRAGFPRVLWRLVRSLREDRIDVVHTFLVDSIYAGALAGRLAGVRAVTTSRRSLDHWHTPAHRLLLRLFNPLATRICANSEAVKRCVVRTEGVPPWKVDVIRNGVELVRARPTEDELRRLRREIGLEPEDLVLCVVSNHRPLKRLDVFLQAMREVLAFEPRAKAILIGDGPPQFTAELRNHASRLNLDRAVFFLGPKPDVAGYLSISDLGLLCSASEGLSNSVLEYMAAGLPVVATRVGGNIELVDATCGILVPADDPNSLAQAVVRILADPAIRVAMGQAGLARVSRRYSWEASIAAWQDHYLRLLRRPRTPTRP
jgi:glycosyltransferase involved in cell wall biosynthesis